MGRRVGCLARIPSASLVPSEGVDINHANGPADPAVFDLILTNPPFGSIMRGEVLEILGRFELGHGRKSLPLEVLGLERCFQFLEPGGRLGIVLPDGLLKNKNMRFVRAWIRKFATGSSYPAILDADVLKTLVPKIPQDEQEAVAQYTVQALWERERIVDAADMELQQKVEQADLALHGEGVLPEIASAAQAVETASVEQQLKGLLKQASK